LAFQEGETIRQAPLRARLPPNRPRRKDIVPRDFTFGEAAIVVVGVTMGLILGFGSLMILLKFM
jgi:hypothetical protein